MSSKVVTVDEALEEVPFGSWQCLLVVAGSMIQMSDGMQVTLLAFLYQCAGGAFGLDRTRAAMLVAIVFAGEFAAAVTSGPISDMCGRKSLTLATGVILTVAGMASAAAPNFWAFLVARFFVGCAVGLYPVNFDLYAELLGPWRAVCLSVTTACFPLGAVFCAGMAAVLLPSWRVLTVVSSIPGLVGLIAMVFSVEESPQFLINSGNATEAVAVLTRIAGHPVKLADTLGYNTFDKSVMSLMERYPLRFPKALVLWTMMGTTYGFQVLTGRAFNNAGSCNFDYVWLILGYSCGFVGAVTFPTLLLDRIGRIPMILSGLGGTIAGLITFTFSSERPVQIAALCFVFLSNSVTWTAAWVITPELFDTSVRATAHTSCFAIARISAFVFTAVFGYGLRIRTLALTIAGFAFVAGLATCTLPETLHTHLS